MEPSRKDIDLRTIAERQEYIRSQEEHLAFMRRSQDTWIAWARNSGASFTEIGQALGVSKQAATERYHKIEAQKLLTDPDPNE